MKLAEPLDTLAAATAKLLADNFQTNLKAATIEKPAWQFQPDTNMFMSKYVLALITGPDCTRTSTRQVCGIWQIKSSYMLAPGRTEVLEANLPDFQSRG